MPNIGPWEVIVVLIIALVILGPKKLPGLGKSLGTSLREFKDSVSGKGDSQKLPEASTRPVAADTAARTTGEDAEPAAAGASRARDTTS
jgi:sec-independent protein translocase protein TatA